MIGTADRLRVVRHPGPCGRRVPSPHPDCRARTEPYRAAEELEARLTGPCVGPVPVVIVRCHACGSTTWQATA